MLSRYERASDLTPARSENQMPSNFIEFRGKAFFDKDIKVWVFLHYLLLEAEKVPNPPVWLTQLHHVWQIQLQRTPIALADLSLDEFVTEDSRVLFLIDLVHRTIRELEKREHFLKDDLNRLFAGLDDGEFTSDLPTERFRSTGLALLRLLEGKVDPGSPLGGSTKPQTIFTVNTVP